MDGGGTQASPQPALTIPNAFWHTSHSPHQLDNKAPVRFLVHGTGALRY